MLETLDAAAVRRWCGGGLKALRAHQDEIDGLNVYPVPDGDTGTNLVLTLTSAQEALDAPDADERGALDANGLGALDAFDGRTVAEHREGSKTLEPHGDGSTPLGRAMLRMARGALLGARGNSGVIVSQILRGMADSLAATVAVRGSDLARALRSASEAAYAAVSRPVEGTVLSVVAAAADGAGRIKSDDLLAVAREAARSAAEALARTPQQLPVLARAGVVDAGGRGLCLLLDALVEALSGEATPEATGKAHDHERTTLSSFGYEVQYLLDADAAAVDKLRRVLGTLGDSLAVVGTGEDGVATWNVHIHVRAANIGASLEAGIEAGRPHRISVTPLDQGEPDPAKRGAVVVAAGEGLTAIFEAEGATVVGRNPSTREVLEAIGTTGAGLVVLLPNDAGAHTVAISAAREAEAMGVRVSVVPTRSPVQALAALAVRDTARAFSDDVIGMAEAAGACRYGEVCTAERDSLTVAGPCQAGNLLGLVDGEVHLIGTDLAEVSRRLLDRMLGGGGELTTVVLGADAPAELEETLRTHTTQAWPFVELHCYAGGQPRYHLLVGVE